MEPMSWDFFAHFINGRTIKLGEVVWTIHVPVERDGHRSSYVHGHNAIGCVRWDVLPDEFVSLWEEAETEYMAMCDAPIS